MRSGGQAGSTFDGGLFAWVFLRIDHLFIPQAWCSEDTTTFGVPGSDHRGIAGEEMRLQRLAQRMPLQRIPSRRPIRVEPGPGRCAPVVAIAQPLCIKHLQ